MWKSSRGSFAHCLLLAQTTKAKKKEGDKVMNVFGGAQPNEKLPTSAEIPLRGDFRQTMLGPGQIEQFGFLRARVTPPGGSVPTVFSYSL
jgi:hypothetical protein